MLYLENFSTISINKKEIEENTIKILKALSLLDRDLSISFIDDMEMKKLNLEYRNINKTTDVLSFAQNEGIFNPNKNLGDCIISLEEAHRQTKEENIEIDKKIMQLIIHSILHLIGYDHYEEEEAFIMRKKEKEIYSLIFTE